jgi:hypothetical protein
MEIDMGKKFKTWLDSGANIHSCNRQEIDIEEFGLDNAEWDEMTDEDKTDFMKEIIFESLDWGYEEVE